MDILIKVKKVVVLTNNRGTDHVCLHLDGPTPFPILHYDGTASIEVQAGYGVQWCKDVLGIEPEVIIVHPK